MGGVDGLSMKVSRKTFIHIPIRKKEKKTDEKNAQTYCMTKNCFTESNKGNAHRFC